MKEIARTLYQNDKSSLKFSLKMGLNKWSRLSTGQKQDAINFLDDAIKQIQLVKEHISMIIEAETAKTERRNEVE